MKELEKEFVPYEESLELKELGFDEPCFGRWLVVTRFEIPTGEIKFQLGAKYEKWSRYQYLAPTYRQAFKYLLKKYNIYGIVIPTITMHWTFKTMTVIEGMIEVPPYKHVDAYDYPTQEEAELECLRKLIEIAKTKELKL